MNNKIKELRKKKKLTQEELAQKINVTKLTISRWERGERVPKSDKAQQLAEFFEVSVDYLLGYDNVSKNFEEIFRLKAKNHSNDEVKNNLEDQDEEAKNKIEETYLRFITDSEKLKELKEDTLVAIRFTESIQNKLRHGITQPYSYAWELDKISFFFIDLLERIEQRENELEENKD